VENYRQAKIKVWIAIVLFVCPYVVSAYVVPAHKALSTNIYSEYNRLYPANQLTQGDLQALLNGAEHEDDHPRYTNHFYDPINNKGLTGVAFGTYPRSIDWATSPRVQATANHIDRPKVRLFEQEYDHSWQRAIHEYVYGDRARAMRSLGQVLHLVEDLTSVPHTRDDKHSGSVVDGSSIYEGYTASLTPSVELQSVRTYKDIEKLFKSTALYTNTNFLSADTVFDGYTLPQISNNDVLSGAKYQVVDDGVYLIRFVYETNRRTGTKVLIDLILDDPKVQSSYWQHLSHKAVESGVALVDLFFEEVEKERQSEKLKHMNKSKDEVKNLVSTINKANKFSWLWGVKAARDEIGNLSIQEWKGYKAVAKIYDIELPELEYAVEEAVAEEEGTRIEEKPKQEDKPKKQPKNEQQLEQQDPSPQTKQEFPKQATAVALDYSEMQALLDQLQKMLEDYIISLQRPDKCAGKDMSIFKYATCVGPFEEGGYAYGGGGAGGSAPVGAAPPIVGGPIIMIGGGGPVPPPVIAPPIP